MSYVGNKPAQTTIPVDDSVTTAMLKDDAVTADKVANAINTSIAANTSKVTNATHTGDVTGATALTIAVDAVDIAMLSATGTADSTTFLRGDNAWAAAGGGKVAQVVMGTTTTLTTTTSTSYVDSTLTVDITPSATSSKVLVLGMFHLQTQGTDYNVHARWQLLRDSTVIVPDQRWSSRASPDITDIILEGDLAICYLDSPSTTSATTYKVQFKVASGDEASAQNDSNMSSLIVLEITT